MVTVDGVKMGKSLGNYVTIKDALERHDPMTIRFFILSSHYTSPTDFSEEALEAAGRGLERLLGAVAVVFVPVSLVAILKLKRQDLSSLLEACGWAVNASMRPNRAQRRQFTRRAPFPEGAKGTPRHHWVTVDMIATGTDIKPVEILMFMRVIKNRIFFEQMKGRGTRTILPTDLRAVTPDAAHKTHFVIVDAVGVCEDDKTDSRPLERKRSVAFDKLIRNVALGVRDEDTLSSLAGRLARLDRQIEPKDRQAIEAAAGGKQLCWRSWTTTY